MYEANVRLRDPIYGCMGAISALQQQIQLLQAELNAVRAEILKYKFNDPNNHVSNIITTNNNPSSSSHNHLTFFSSATSVSIAAPPPPPSPPPLSPPLHDLDHHPSINPTISSSMYTPTQPSSSRNDHDDHNHDHYSSISNENISYFD